MKKTETLLFLAVSIICIFFGTAVYAANQSVEFVVNNNTSNEGTVTIKVTNEEAIGVIKGKINYDSNFESIEITPSYNGWTTTYNEETRAFNSFCAKGTADGEVLEIKYKLKNNVSSGKITLSEIGLTTISYNTITIEKSITKEVTRLKEEDKSTENEKENIQTINYTGNSTNYKIDDTTTNKILPNTGHIVSIAIFIVVSIIVIFIIIKNIQYKEI